MKKILLCTLIFTAAHLAAKPFEYKKSLANQKGVQAYEQGNYEKAKKKFEENALKNPKDGRTHYNLGNNCFREADYAAASQHYELALRDNELADKEKLYHNMGNAAAAQKNYKKALEYYREALKENSHHQPSRYNYELVSKIMQKQQKQQKQKSDQNQENKDENKKDKKEEGQKKEDENKEQGDKEKKKAAAKKEKHDKSKEEAEKMLKALLAKEKEKMEKKKVRGVAPKSGKYW